MSWWSRVTAVIIVCPAALMNIVPETRRKTVLDILGMIIGVKLSFVVDIRIIKNVSFKATKAFWCCHRHVLRLSLAPLVSFTNSFYIFKTNFQCTFHSFWNMGIRINQAYAEHKLMKTFTKYIHFLQSELNILYGVQKISAFIHTFWNWGGRRNISLSQLFPRWSQRSTLLCPTQHWPTFTALPFKCHLTCCIETFSQKIRELFFNLRVVVFWQWQCWWQPRYVNMIKDGLWAFARVW